jgi:lipopolysaccharide heptosyltransferase II
MLMPLETLPMSTWKDCKNILVIQTGNIGSVLMSSPAVRALKESFKARITLLTSSGGAAIAPYIPEIDEIIAAELPWIQAKTNYSAEQYASLIEQLKEKKFDAAVIFSSYSENALPSALLAFQANIPKRLGYCREDAQDLLTNQIPDKEPYNIIHHQVERDLALVASVDAKTYNNNLGIAYSEEAKEKLKLFLHEKGVDAEQPYIILHPGVNEKKREFPSEKWTAVCNELWEHVRCPILITGTANEKHLTEPIASNSPHCYDISGELTTEMFIALIAGASLVLSVNTGTIHIAAATHTPVVVLYALTNPQHTPWKVPSAVLPFSVKKDLKSKNQIVAYVSEKMPDDLSYPDTATIIKEAIQLIAIVKPAVLQQPIPVLHN